MRRRTFLVGGAAATAAAIGVGAFEYDRRQSDLETRTYGSTVMSRRRPRDDAPNVLFISLDDCNDWVGFLRNHPGTHTPNLDALARQSVVFSKAYCTAPMCRPARTSVMFGRRPYEVGMYDHSDASNARYAALSRTSASLVDDFWADGYEVAVAGKVFGDFPEGRFTQSLPTPLLRPDPSWRSPYDGRAVHERSPGPIDFGPSGQSPTSGPDGVTADWVRAQLLAPRSRPLFVGYGAVSTHLAWRVPQRYFDLHPLDAVVVPDHASDDLDDLSAEGRALADRRTFDDLRRRQLDTAAVQAYQAAMSYVDDRIGVVLDALASTPGGDEVVVVVWSDHGFHLGEKLHWQKFTLWEHATRIPMLLRIPGREAATFDRPVSALDLGPTLTDLAGVVPHEQASGESLVPALATPALADARPPVSTWRPGNHAVRQGPWRFIRYRSGAAELYDHRVDPEERTNLAGRPEHVLRERELATFLPSPDQEVDFDRVVETAGTD